MAKIVATVLKSGGEFEPWHVYRLRDQVARVSPDAHFVCLTDDNRVDGDTIRLTQSWPGWWSKIELFKPGVWGDSILYLDLDTTIIEDISPLFRSEFTMLTDFYKPEQPASGVMAWEGEPPTEVFEAFCHDPERYRKAYFTPMRWGDQGFIRDHVKRSPHRFGPEIVSYKVHCQDEVPERAKVIAFHGKPRPWDLTQDGLR